MAVAAVKAKATAAMTRRDLAEELLALRKRNALVYAREADLKNALKAAAEAEGENFKESFPGLGKVVVSASKERRCNGQEFVLMQDVFLDSAERERLIKAGMVKAEKIWTGAYYGRVDVELF